MLCSEKYGYSKKDAETKRNFIKKERGILLRIYPCPICGKYHLTHTDAH